MAKKKTMSSILLTIIGFLSVLIIIVPLLVVFLGFLRMHRKRRHLILLYHLPGILTITRWLFKKVIWDRPLLIV